METLVNLWVYDDINCEKKKKSPSLSHNAWRG